MENNILIKGLWAGIIISLTIGNIFIIPMGEINHILMVLVASVTLIILIILLIFLMTRNKSHQTSNPDELLEDRSVYYSFSNSQVPFNYSTPKPNYSTISNPMGLNYYIYANYDHISNSGKKIYSPQSQSSETTVQGNVKTFQLSKDSIFKIPTPKKGAAEKIFLEEHMTKDDKRFLKGLAT